MSVRRICSRTQPFNWPGQCNFCATCSCSCSTYSRLVTNQLYSLRSAIVINAENTAERERSEKRMRATLNVKYAYKIVNALTVWVGNIPCTCRELSYEKPVSGGIPNNERYFVVMFASGQCVLALFFLFSFSFPFWFAPSHIAESGGTKPNAFGINKHKTKMLNDDD